MKTKTPSPQRRAKPALLPALVFCSFFACSPGKVDEESLRLYAAAAGAYRDANYEEVREILSKTAFPQALLLRGKAEYFAGKAGEAEKTLRRVRDLLPGNAESALYLARILRERGKTEEARELVEGLLRDNPLDIRALRLAAGLARERGPAGEAAENAFLDRAAEASAEAGLAFLDRAQLRWKKGRGEEALEDLGRARALLAGNRPLVSSINNLERTITRRMGAGSGGGEER